MNSSKKVKKNETLNPEEEEKGDDCLVDEDYSIGDYEKDSFIDDETPLEQTDVFPVQQDDEIFETPKQQLPKRLKKPTMKEKEKEQTQNNLLMKIAELEKKLAAKPSVSNIIPHDSSENMLNSLGLSLAKYFRAATTLTPLNFFGVRFAYDQKSLTCFDLIFSLNKTKSFPGIQVCWILNTKDNSLKPTKQSAALGCVALDATVLPLVTKIIQQLKTKGKACKDFNETVFVSHSTYYFELTN